MAGVARVAGVAALGLRVASTSGWSTTPRRCFARWTAPWECSATMALPWSDACSLGICGVCAANSVGTAHTAASPKSLRSMAFSLRREVGDRLERSARPLPRQQARTGPAAGDFTQPGCHRGVGRRDEASGAEPDVCERLGDYFLRLSGVDTDAIGERVHAAAVTVLELAHCRRITARYQTDHGEDGGVRAWDRLADGRARDKFAGWLFLILRNRWFAEQRRGQREGGPHDERDDSVAAADRPDGTFEQTGRMRALERSLVHLTPEQREDFVLKHVEGLAYDEIE